MNPKWWRCVMLPTLGATGQLVPQEIPINSGRPTFFDNSVSWPGKIVLEEHVTTNLFQPAFTTPFVNNTNELSYDSATYLADIGPRLLQTSISERVADMDAANITLSIVSLGPPGIQGVFNTSLAVELAAAVNDQIAANYTQGEFADRFEFFCSVAMQDPSSAATELERCVRELGGVGVMVGGYTNIGSIDNITYLDDVINEPFWEKLAELDVPLYLHPRMPIPSQQRVYRGYEFLGASPWGFAAETAAHALRLMVSGLFDRHPTLQIVLGHCGENLPFSLARADSRMRHFDQLLWPATQSLTYYYKNNFYVTTAGTADDAALFDTLRTTGSGRVMFSVDYPFEDTAEIASWFDRVQLDVETKGKVANGNARRLFKLQ
ncbi:hypothetical protein GGR57DRAFT_286692 [Xylariaceae sp. FL1272]|nr:hypothetical protein GGR57DRAFT_286692 [Xylariaceae sp. FL1272]